MKNIRIRHGLLVVGLSTAIASLAGSANAQAVFATKSEVAMYTLGQCVGKKKKNEAHGTCHKQAVTACKIVFDEAFANKYTLKGAQDAWDGRSKSAQEVRQMATADLVLARAKFGARFCSKNL